MASHKSKISEPSARSAVTGGLDPRQRRARSSKASDRGAARASSWSACRATASDTWTTSSPSSNDSWPEPGSRHPFGRRRLATRSWRSASGSSSEAPQFASRAASARTSSARRNAVQRTKSTSCCAAVGSSERARSRAWSGSRSSAVAAGRASPRHQQQENIARRKGGQAAFHNPYNFVPAPPRQTNHSELGDHEPAGHHVYHADRFSGVIRVRMTLVTPMLLPDASHPRVRRGRQRSRNQKGARSMSHCALLRTGGHTCRPRRSRECCDRL